MLIWAGLLFAIAIGVVGFCLPTKSGLGIFLSIASPCLCFLLWLYVVTTPLRSRKQAAHMSTSHPLPD